MFKLRLFLIALLSFAMTTAMFSTSHADLLSITDGTSTFEWDPDAGTNTISSVHGNYSFSFMPMLRYTNSANGLETRSMAEHQGAGVNKSVTTHSVQNNGSTGSMAVEFGTQNGLSSPVVDLEVLLNFEIDTNQYGGVLTYDMTVNNISGRTQNNVEMFQYYDWDVATNQNTGQDFSWEGFDGFLQVGSGSPDQQVFHGTDDLSNWEVAAWDTIQVKLLANGSLTNSGTPYAVGDMTAAFGWNVGSMAAGASTATNGFLIQGVPEPGSAAILMIGFLGTTLVRRRKS